MNRSGGQPVDFPYTVHQGIAKTIVEAIGTALPEFKIIGNQSIATPVPRFWNIILVEFPDVFILKPAINLVPMDLFPVDFKGFIYAHLF